MTLSIFSIVLLRKINVNEVIRDVFRIFYQIVTGTLGQNFLEVGLSSVPSLLLISVLNPV